MSYDVNKPFDDLPALAERQTAADYLKELERIGVLKGQKVGKENLYLNVELYNLLAK